jgi:hypothetical protein
LKISQLVNIKRNFEVEITHLNGHVRGWTSWERREGGRKGWDLLEEVLKEKEKRRGLG